MTVRQFLLKLKDAKVQEYLDRNLLIRIQGNGSSITNLTPSVGKQDTSMNFYIDVDNGDYW
jgi:hypothetical protein